MTDRIELGGTPDPVPPHKPSGKPDDRNGSDPLGAHNDSRARGERIDDPLYPKGSGVLDPRDYFVDVPVYERGQLPEVYENYITDCVAAWGGDPGAYAAMFLSVFCGALHSSVKMNTNPLKPNVLRNPNDHAMASAASGFNKSGMLRDLMRHQEQWQKEMPKASGIKGTPKFMPRVLLQMASTEGALLQIVDNKGTRLILMSEEGMGLLRGAGAHHGTNGNAAVNNLLTTSYDGGMFSKRLVGGMHDIDECLATFTAVGVFTDMAGWDGFDAAVDSGALARFTMGMIAHVQGRDPAKRIKGAEAAMFTMLDKVHALKHVHFRMSETTAARWDKFVAAKEERNKEMARCGETKGLVLWCKKYDMRIMSMAVAFQSIKFIDGGEKDCTEVSVKEPHADAKEDKHAAPTRLRTVEITEETLGEAVALVEGYLLKLQYAFYELAAGVSEFGPELMNFLSYRVATDQPDNPARRIIERRDLTHKGPASVRGAPTEQRKDKFNRWIQALLDHGWIEVYDHPNARKLKVQRKDFEERWFKVRNEVFEHFSSEDDRKWLCSHYEQSRDVGERKNPPKGASF